MPLIDLTRLAVKPLASRSSMSRIDEIVVDPDAEPAKRPEGIAAENVQRAAAGIRAARAKGAGVMLIYGAHLLRNGASAILERMMARGWLTHLATNGAGTIHDWEFSHLGRSTESVRDGVATGTFGTWDETGRAINLAVLAGGERGEGYGTALGRFLAEDGVTLPTRTELAESLRREPEHPLAAARADLLQAMVRHRLPEGKIAVAHPWKRHSLVYQAYAHRVPLTVHPGIGYDIIANHPLFSGAAIGRGAELDFRAFGGSVDTLDDGVVLSVGSAIMGPQVFEKSLSCVNNLRIAAGRPTVKGLTIHVVDLQDGGNWDWTKGEPPKTNAAYYLRFCKSFARMGGTMMYSCCDNLAFMHALYRELIKP